MEAVIKHGTTLAINIQRPGVSDHRFVGGKSLTPSCYLSYSPYDKQQYQQLFVKVRSSQHHPSTAFSHVSDIFNLPDVFSNMKTDNNEIKPIQIFICDGGSDENARFFATRYAFGELFQLWDTDLIIVANNAGGYFYKL